MSFSRANVVAVSSSEQQRETLVIMLDPEFDVTALPTPAAPAPKVSPRAVVLAGDIDADQAPAWTEADVQHVVERWPRAALVLIDPDEAVATRFPGAVTATWADPFSVPAAVTSAAAVQPETRRLTLEAAVRAADLSLRPSLETAQALVALLGAVRRQQSVRVASQVLGEHLQALLDQLAWVDWFDDIDAPVARELPFADDPSFADLSEALRVALDERRLRAECRGIAFDCDLREPCPLPCSPARALALARCLRAALLDLTPGRVSMHTDASGLRCRYAGLDAKTPPFALDAARSLLRQLGVRLSREEGGLTITRDEDHGQFHD